MMITSHIKEMASNWAKWEKNIQGEINKGWILNFVFIWIDWSTMDTTKELVNRENLAH